MLVFACVAIVAWGALAFGAVYPWAYTPLLVACAVTGLLGLFERGRRMPRASRRILFGLLAVGAAAALQLVPLSPSLLETISPATAAFLGNYDLRYAVEPFAHPLSLKPALTMRGLVILAALTLFLAGLARSLSRSRVRRLTVALVTFGAVLALIGIVQKAWLGDHTYMGMKIYGFWTPESKLVVPFGPYVNRNHFAGWMLMGLPLALGLGLGWAERASRTGRGGWRDVIACLSSPEGGRAQLMAVAVAVMGLSLLMTQSRSGLGGMVVAMGLAAVVAGRRRASTRARLAVAGGIAALMVGLVAWGGADVATRAGGSGLTELRPRIWRDTLAVIRDFPLTGTGLNTFGAAMRSYQTWTRDLQVREAHNDYLQIAAEGGLLLAVPAALALAALARAIWRRFRAGSDDTVTGWVRVGATTGLVAIALQSLVEFSLQMPGNAAFAAVLMAVALHEPPPRQHRR